MKVELFGKWKLIFGKVLYNILFEIGMIEIWEIFLLENLFGITLTLWILEWT